MRSARYGQLSCGSCTKAQRDEFRCVLKGQERTPAKVPTYRVEMGQSRRARLFKSCPVGTVLTDDVAQLIAAYNVREAFGEWPPGRRSPRVLDAFVVIKREHNLIDLEAAEKK